MMGERRFIVSTRPVAKFSETEVPCCFDLVNVPVTEFSDRSFSVDDVDEINAFDPDCVVFTSSRGSDIFFSRILGLLEVRERAFYGIGANTCRSVNLRGYSCTCPEDRTSAGLAEFIAERERGKRLLLFRSGQANRVMEKILSAANADFLSVTAYDVVPLQDIPKEVFSSTGCFGIIFTSAMEVESLLGSMKRSGKSFLESIRMFSIGPLTTARMVEMGLEVSDPAGNSDFKELFMKVCQEYCH